MKTLRLCILLKKVVASCTCQLSEKDHRICHYSTLAAVPRRRWSFFSEVCEGESSVYQHDLRFQKPSTIKYSEELENSVSLIGTVWILMKMWHEMAELSINHVKPNDLICLRSFRNLYKDGPPMVMVKELNFVVRNSEGPTYQEPMKVDLEGEDYLEKQRNRLHLWQIFFANPYEWTDFRQSKKSPKFPDFKHRSTGESLWLNTTDPPWLRRQLELFDSQFLGQSPEVHIRSASSISSLLED